MVVPCCWIASVGANVGSSFESFFSGIFPELFLEFEETILFFAADANDFDDECNFNCGVGVDCDDQGNVREVFPNQKGKKRPTKRAFFSTFPNWAEKQVRGAEEQNIESNSAGNCSGHII